MGEYYKNNTEYILDELKRLDFLIHLQVLSQRKTNNNKELKGLYIADEHIDALLNSRPENYHPAQELLEKINVLEKEINRKKEKSLKMGIPLKLERLA